MTSRPLACIAAAACLTACHTREVGGVSQGKKGALIFSDDFERAEIGDAWSRGTGEAGAGKWTIRDGWVHGSDIKNDPLWYNEPLPRHVRVEFDAKALSQTGDLKVEIFGDGQNHASGYVLIFGGWDNTLDVIARLDEHGDDRKARSSMKVEPNRVYKMAVERRGKVLAWFIDGKPFMHYDDSSPLQGPKNGHFAFNDWAAPVAFDNFRVFELE